MVNNSSKKQKNNFFEYLLETKFAGSSIPLYMYGADPNFRRNIVGGVTITDEIPLYTFGLQGNVGVLPLTIGGRGYYASDTILLFLQNIFLEDNIPLYIQGQGTLTDGYPGSGSLDLFICRNARECIPLYMLGGDQPSESGNIPMHINGSQAYTDSITLVIPSTYSDETDTIPMYIHGF